MGILGQSPVSILPLLPVYSHQIESFLAKVIIDLSKIYASYELYNEDKSVKNSCKQNLPKSIEKKNKFPLCIAIAT